jgi:hypothetical protein
LLKGGDPFVRIAALNNLGVGVGRQTGNISGRDGLTAEEMRESDLFLPGPTSEARHQRFGRARDQCFERSFELREICEFRKARRASVKLTRRLRAAKREYADYRTLAASDSKC